MLPLLKQNNQTKGSADEEEDDENTKLLAERGKIKVEIHNEGWWGLN